MEAFISAGDVIVRYARYGKGERVVVLLHGYAESIEVWESLGGQLGKSADVIAVDLPGSGISDWGGREVISIDFMAQTVASLITKLGIEHYNVIGHSMGGYVAVALADIDQERVDSLVLFHSSPFGDTEDKRLNREREIRLIEEGKKELLASINPEKGFATANLHRCEEAIDEKFEQFMLTPDEALIATLKGMANRADRTDSFDATSKRIATLMIFGADDHHISAETRAAMIERFPLAQNALLERSGHMGFIEQPAESLHILTEFYDHIKKTNE